MSPGSWGIAVAEGGSPAPTEVGGDIRDGDTPCLLMAERCHQPPPRLSVPMTTLGDVPVEKWGSKGETEARVTWGHHKAREQSHPPPLYPQDPTGIPGCSHLEKIPR